MSNRLINKVAIVTGAASGVGEATARRFVAEGGREIADELGANAQFVQQDVGSPEGWRELATLVRERYQRLDVLVNNAGILIPGTIEEASLEDWHKLLRINSDSVFLGCQTA